MRPAPPISVQQWTRALSRWDVLAVLLVLGILIFFAEASRNLLQPMAELRMTPLSLEPTHLPEYAARTTLRMLLALGPLSGLHLHLCDAGSQEQTRRGSACAALGHSSVGADPRLRLRHDCVLHVACPWSGAGCGVRRHLCDLHEPGLEHGIQLLPILAHGSDRTRRGLSHFQALRV